jgi:hypothetical protein
MPEVRTGKWSLAAAPWPSAKGRLANVHSTEDAHTDLRRKAAGSGACGRSFRDQAIADGAGGLSRSRVMAVVEREAAGGCARPALARVS